MIRYDQKTLRKIQLVQLGLLQEADRICRRHQISYVIIAGTLLGAVRHGGFIPWDDDADIALLREDYERFVKACQEDLGSDFYFQDHRVTPGYRWGYGKLRRRDSLFLREHQEEMSYEQGIFIDVFPLDAVPQSCLGRTVKNFECFLVRKMLYAPVGKRADKNRLKRGIYSLLERIPDRWIFGHYEKMIRKAKETKSDWVRILMFPTPNREYGYLRRWYTGRKEISFEGISFPGIADYDNYLRFKFGDYMTLPPAEQRKTHPVSALRLPEEP